MYYNDFGHYPVTPIPSGAPITNLCFSNLGITSTCGTIVYSSKLPGDPIASQSYVYTQLNNGSDYTLAFTLEQGAASYQAGNYQATPNGIIAGGGGSATPPSGWVCGDSITFNYRGVGTTYGTVLNSTTSKCWLDRNLGATQVAQASNDVSAYGHLFQWGRGDDGHQIRTSLTVSTLSNTDNPGHDRFIANTNSNDWRNPQNDNLWQGVNGINNPCPNGFRLPTQGEWDAERQSWSANNRTGAFDSPLKLTAAGFRTKSGGTASDLGSYGMYWTSSISGVSSTALRLAPSNDPPTASLSTYDRGSARSVRCIKD